jgi:hypothetical protein
MYIPRCRDNIRGTWHHNARFIIKLCRFTNQIKIVCEFAAAFSAAPPPTVLNHALQPFDARVDMKSGGGGRRCWYE